MLAPFFAAEFGNNAGDDLPGAFSFLGLSQNAGLGFDFGHLAPGGSHNAAAFLQLSA